MKYKYVGPVPLAATIKVNGKPIDVLAQVGAEVELPENNEYTKTLIAHGYLQTIKAVAVKKIEGGK